MRSFAMEVWLSLVVVGANACMVDGIDDEDLVFRDGSTGGTNPPPGGGRFIGNGLVSTDFGDIDPDLPLSSAVGPSAVGWSQQTLQRMEYLVECALAEGDELVVGIGDDELVLEGLVGLAPEWKDGLCEQACQEWVSACLMARTNVTGQPVLIWIAGAHPALGFGHDPDFPLREATFYGNVFVESSQPYACRGTLAGEHMALLDGRICMGAETESCGFEVFEECQLDQRCTMEEGIPTDCRAGEPPAGEEFRSITSFVAIPES